MKRSNSTTVIFLILILAIIWGSSFIMMKKGLIVYTPYQIGAIRMFVSMICLLPFLVRHFHKVEKSRWKFLLLAGLCGNGIPAVLFPLAETQISSALAGMINSMVPIFTLILGILFFKLRLNSRKIAGLVLGLAGALFFVSGGNSESGGDSNYSWYIVIATVGYAISVNTIRTHLLSLDAIRNTGFSLLFAGTPLGIYLFSTDFLQRTFTHPDAMFSLSCIILLAVLGTVISTILFNHLIRISDSLTASSVTYFIPVVALAWGLFDGEKPALIHYIGFVLIMSGVFVTSRTSLQKEKSENNS